MHGKLLKFEKKCFLRTPNILMEDGVSHLVSGYIRSIGALTKEESRNCGQSMFKAFGVDETDVTHDWPKTLAAHADCWPQQLHNGMRALAQELPRPDVNGALRNVSIPRVSNTEKTFRH